MPLPLHQISADHRTLVAAAATSARIDDPVVVQLDEFQHAVLEHAVRGPFVPIDGMFVRDWDRYCPRQSSGMRFGIRLYTLDGIRLARCSADYCDSLYNFVYDFFVVARANYLPLFRAAVRLRRRTFHETPPPILPDAIFDTLHRNTLDYLNRDNLTRIRELGGRPRRGLLLSGPPGNGKTSACRWLWEECHRLRYEYKIISPDAYRAARESCNPVEAVKQLFVVNKRGIVFFDDMDIALRDRALSPERDDQNVFLGAMDGIEAKEGVVYVFTTNCPVDLIDPAFKRPGRIDLVLQFDPPDAELRHRLVDRWHAEIREAIDLDRVVADTAGRSYAEIEELKNLLIILHLDGGAWDWAGAMRQWAINRHDLSADRMRAIGFHCNGAVTHN
jgi:adenylate kinase family enzyme